MKKIILIAMVVLVAFGCTKEESQPKEIDGVVMQIFTNFQVYDTNGVDLLNPQNQFALNDIKMYEYIDGIETLVYNENLYNNPKGYQISSPEDYKILYGIDEKLSLKDWMFSFWPRINDTPDYDTTLMLEHEEFGHKSKYIVRKAKVKIQWNETNSDIITAEIKQFYPSGSMFLHKVLVNGELKWEAKSLYDECYLKKTIT